MKQIGFGIIGTGGIANMHAEAIGNIQGSNVTAVYDQVPERARDFAEKLGAHHAQSLDDLLARDDVDAVILATPSGARLELAVQAANHGKHVLCEKPLEVTLERADAIIDACEHHHVILGCVFQMRLSRGIQRVLQTIREGRLGRLLLADAHVNWFRTPEYYANSGWRGTWKLDGGGALMNQGIHVVDQLLMFMGDPISVHAFAEARVHDIEVEDTVAAVIRFANGAMGTLSASTACAPGFPRRLEISGENGTIGIEDDRIVRWQFADQTPADDQILIDYGKGENMRGGSSDPLAIASEGHRRQLTEFADAIRENRPPMIPGQEGRRAVELITGIYRSAKTGQLVTFDHN